MSSATAQATERSLESRAGKKESRAAAAARLAKGRQERAATPTVHEELPTTVQLDAEKKLDQQLREQRRQRDRKTPSPFTFDVPAASEEPEHEEATGCRLMDLDLFNAHITRWLPCPTCGSFALFCRTQDEYAAGLGGTLKFWCEECTEITHSLPLCKPLPHTKGPGIAAANVRLVLGAAQIGAGETQMAQLFGTLNVPVVRGTTWANSEELVTAAVGGAAEESRRAARQAEMLAAFDRGTPVDADGKVPITVEYDMCWAKRSSGKAYNSLEGSGSALGAVTGKVLVSKVMKKACDRCNKGICDGGSSCNRNYKGSSGGMESTAGGDMILELAQDAEGCGIRLQQYVTDLDAKTAAAVRHAAAEAGIDLPEQKYDPGHWKKGFGKDLIEVLASWSERIEKAKQRPDEPVILAGHNGHSVDWTVMYWGMVKAGMRAYEWLAKLGVIGVLDTLKLAKQLPAKWVDKLLETEGGRPSFANKSVFAALTNRSLDEFVWHRAVDDARATGLVLCSGPFRTMLPKMQGTKALIKIEQLVLSVHHEHNERVKATNGTGAPAGKKRRVSTCTYCGGREQPAHLSRRTCPKRLREEAAHAGAGPAGSV